ncbi:MAG: type II secretion system F family protein [Thermoleophilia bacterium]|nr:type II secretion system F family protein [Thermoleophilia bacterium]
MRNVAVALIAILAAACTAAAAAGAARPGFELSRPAGGGADFPERTFVLSFPRRADLDRVRVKVTENGSRVSDPTVIPASLAGGKELATVLLVDTSESMAGHPIAAAMEGARLFAARRSPQQQLAVVAFDGAPRVLLPFTTDQARIDAVLGRTPRLAYGTGIFDALVRASELVRSAGIESASFVLLSDGADVGSTATRETAAAAVAEAHARVFSIGLRSRAFDATTLAELAKKSGGRFAEARAPQELPRIFDQLGFELSRQWILRYRSLARSNERVRVAVRVEGFPGVARAMYVAPSFIPPAPPLYSPSTVQSLWRSPVTFALVSLLAAGLIAFGLLALLKTRRDDSLRRRLSEFVSFASTAGEPDGGGQASATDPSGRASRWARFEEALEIAELPISAARIVALTVTGTLGLALVLWIVLGAAASLVAVLVPLAVRAMIARRLNARRSAFEEQLPDNLAVLAGALRAGHSLVGALSVVVDDAAEPTRKEFRRVVADEQLGVPLEVSLTDVARRMECPDLEQVALVSALGRETGGNTAEVLDRVTETIRERGDVRRLVRTLTVQGRMSRWVVSALPPLLILAILAINPDYLQPLVDHTLGRVMLVMSALMVVAGSLVIRRIVNIKV